MRFVQVDIVKNIRVNQQQMEEIEGITMEYPYVMHKLNADEVQIPWHWHEELEFNYIVKGKMQVFITGQVYEFQEGEAFFINTNTLCFMKNSATCEMESHLFHSTFLSGHFRSIYETKYMNPILQSKEIEVIEIRGITEEQKEILKKLRQASALQCVENSEFQTRNIFSEIWILLLKEIANRKERYTPTTSVSKERLMTMMAFIQFNYAQKLTLAEIASSASISEREALRCFQMNISETPFEYLMGYRVERAKKLLNSSTLSITEIAIQTGFSNSAYFSKIFKRIVKLTPKEYRKLRDVS